MNSLNDVAAWRNRIENFFAQKQDKATPSVDNIAVKVKEIKRIAVFLPVYYGLGGSFKGLKNVAKMIHWGSERAGEPVQVVVSVLAGAYNLQKDFNDLKALGITVRETNWRIFNYYAVDRMRKFVGENPLQNPHPEYILPDDGINYFQDCDFWFLISDRTSLPLAPLRPYGMLIYDYIQRYVPNVLPKDFLDTPFLLTARGAAFVFCTTPFTCEAAVQYAGINRKNVHLAPMEVDLPEENSDQAPLNLKLDELPLTGRKKKKIQSENNKTFQKYMLWPTNTASHKNQVAAIMALEEYYTKHQGQLAVVITGVNTHWYDLSQKGLPQHDDPAIAPVRAAIASNSIVQNNCIVAGELPENKYEIVLRNAQFIFHPCLVDNGAYAVVEAAYYGVPSLSNDYPAMRYMNQRFALNLHFCNARNPVMTGKSLKEMELALETAKGYLPSRSFLQKFTAENVADEFWGKLSTLMGESI